MRSKEKAALLQSGNLLLLLLLVESGDKVILPKLLLLVLVKAGKKQLFYCCQSKVGQSDSSLGTPTTAMKSREEAVLGKSGNLLFSYKC